MSCMFREDQMVSFSSSVCYLLPLLVSDEVFDKCVISEFLLDMFVFWLDIFVFWLDMLDSSLELLLLTLEFTGVFCD